MEITVVIPLYNKVTVIKETLSSVATQTFTNFSVIIVDDGSTDGSVEVVKNYCDENPSFASKIQIIEQKNAGVSVARNTGIFAAKTEYIALLDADDFWAQNHLQTLAELVEKFPNCAMWTTRSGRLRINGTFVHRNFEDEKSIYGTAEKVYKKRLVHSSSVLIRKENALAVGGFPIGIKSAEDIVFWVKMMSNYGFAWKNVSTSFFRERPSILFTGKRDRKIDFPNAGYQLLEEFYSEHKNILGLRRLLASHALGLSVVYKQQHMIGAAWRMTCKSLSYQIYKRNILNPVYLLIPYAVLCKIYTWKYKREGKL